MLVLPSDSSHLLHFNFLGPLRPPANRLLYCGKTQWMHLNHKCKHSFRHCFLIKMKASILNAFSSSCLCSFQVPNTPGIFTSLIRFYLFWRFASVNQSSPSYKPMRIWRGGGHYENEKRWQICWLHGGLQQSSPITCLVFLSILKETEFNGVKQMTTTVIKWR